MFLAITAGAIISGAYFGDKLSPLSETTNLAAAVTRTDLFNHIQHALDNSARDSYNIDCFLIYRT